VITVYVEGVGITGPGLDGWPAARSVLSGEAPYIPSAIVSRPILELPPAERRRAGAATRLAIGVASEAIGHAERDPRTMAMVFTSSSGEGDTVHDILCVLATETREVSPTRFHNSVHNAPAGYWAVATGSREPGTSLCAYDASFSAGLLDAAAHAIVDERPVTLAAYDVPYPRPLGDVRPIAALFAVALVLTPWATDKSIARLTVAPGRDSGDESVMENTALEQLRVGVPAARGLPLLAALVATGPTTIVLRAAAGTGAEILVEREW
jgi:hypothetical protein